VLLDQFRDVLCLLSVVTGKVLRASDVWFMNDAREALYGIELIRRVLDALDLTPAPLARFATEHGPC
jgi:hypothetical protein